MNKIENRKKRKGAEERKTNSPMLISLLSLIVCLVMLASCCYAWFTAAQGAKINIEAGTFGVKAVVSQSDVVVGDSVTQIEVEATGSESAIVRIKNGGTYQVSLTATGETSKGFCKVTVTVKDTAGQAMGENVYCTGTILKGEAFTFALESTGGGTTEITIQPSWGEYREDSGVGSTLIEDKIVVEGEVEVPVENIAETASEETDTVVEITVEETTEAVATTAEVASAEVETTAAETTTGAETTAEETTEAETCAEVETTTVAETTAEETTETVETTAEETTETVETTDAESSVEAETTVNATVEATAETMETVVDTTEADTTEAVETAKTTAEATTESLSAEE